MIKFGKKQVILSVVAVLVLGIMIAANIVTVYFWNFLMMTFGADTTDFDSERVQSALLLGDEFVQSSSENSMVLMKNENEVLPLAEDNRRINLFGYGSSDNGFILTGGGAGGTVLNRDTDFKCEYKTTLRQAFEKEGFEVNEELQKIYSDFSDTDRDGAKAQIALCEPEASVYTEEVLTQAKEFSDTAAVVISRFCGENKEMYPYQDKVNLPRDDTRTYLELSTEEEDMLGIVCDNFENVIVLLNTGNPLDMSYFDSDKIDAIMYVGIPGQSGALAVPRLLKGYKTNADGEKEYVTPSGKLADTYTYTNEYDPAVANIGFVTEPTPKYAPEVAYAENIYVGYRWYETADAENYFASVSNEYGKGYDGVVAYPFGYGMSYTDFSWTVEDISLPAGSQLTAESEITVSVRVENTGDVPGRDVVQLYSTPEYHKGGIEKSEVNLVAFAKTQILDPGVTQLVKLSVSAYDLAAYDAYDKNGNGHAGYELDAGEYTLSLRTDAHTVSEATGAVTTYNVPSAVNFNEDPVTGKTVKNRFTGDEAYMDLPIDGNSIGDEKIVYLSRNDFAGTFPTSLAPARNGIAKVTEVNTAKNTRYDTDVFPTSGVESGLRFVTKADGTDASMADLRGNTDAELVYNEELMMELGKDFDSPKWETLLNQMSLAEYKAMVEYGGFRTAPIGSIGKPKSTDYDGPAGFHSNSTGSKPKDRSGWTAFPIEALLGCAWSEEVCYNLGRAQGVIANATGISGWYAPGMNMHRHHYNGRNFEYFSEDPLLTGKLGSEIIRGAKNMGLYCYMKHFAASEEGINPENVYHWMTEQSLREIYLRPFEIATKEGGANGVMTSFSCIGAVWSGACDPMNNDILRDEWGFRGALLSDWSTGRPYMNAEQAIRGGNDFMLDANNNGFSPVDTANNATTANLARTASKNILYMWANTYATAKDFQANGSTDDRYNVDLDIKISKEPFSPIPILMLVGINVLCVAGMAVCVIFILKKPKSKAQ